MKKQLRRDVPRYLVGLGGGPEVLPTKTSIREFRAKVKQERRKEPIPWSPGAHAAAFWRVSNPKLAKQFQVRSTTAREMANLQMRASVNPNWKREEHGRFIRGVHDLFRGHAYVSGLLQTRGIAGPLAHEYKSGPYGEYLATRKGFAKREREAYIHPYLGRLGVAIHEARHLTDRRDYPEKMPEWASVEHGYWEMPLEQRARATEALDTSIKNYRKLVRRDRVARASEQIRAHPKTSLALVGAGIAGGLGAWVKRNPKSAKRLVGSIRNVLKVGKVL